MSGPYARVGTRAAEPAANDAERQRQQQRRDLYDRIGTKVQAALWVIAAILAFVYGKVPAALADQSGSKNVLWSLSLGYAALGIVLCLWAYLTLWLPYIARIDLPWSTYVPWAIPTASAAGVASFLCFTVGLWPSYGLLTPALVLVLYIGAIMSAHFIPAW